MTTLAILGSGETTPTMVTLHQRLLADAADPVLLSTPYGFQENADDITARTVAYFEQHVGVAVRPLDAAAPAALDGLARESLLADVRAADWVFAGPGSPSYLVRQWAPTPLPGLLRDKLSRAGHDVIVFASAAACTLGARAVPVYEIYKAGFAPHWLDGLDLLDGVGLDAVVIPHFDNAEGGTHDTRFCYLGERRLRSMEEELPSTTWVLGVDEHTAAVLDFDAGSVQVTGRGALTVRARDHHVTFPAGAVVGLDALEDAALGRGHPDAPPPAATAGRPSTAGGGDGAPDAASTLGEAVTLLERAFDEALARGDALAATEQVLAVEAAIEAWSSDTLQSDDRDRARRTLRQLITRLGRVADGGLHDHRDLVAPHVETLLDLRSRARSGGDYDTADEIRDALTEVGVDVRDRPDGTDWEWQDPLQE